MRSILKINNSTKLYNVNLKCSNLVNSLSINNVCKPLLERNTIIYKQDSNNLTSYRISNIINTIRKNLVTIDNYYPSSAKTAPRLVQNGRVLLPDEHKSRTFAKMRPSSSITHLYFDKYSSHIQPCHQMNNIFSNPITSHPSINVITVPSKFWRKKPVNTHTPLIYDDVDEDLYEFKTFGRSMKRSSHYTPRPSSDFILWDKSVDELEYLRDLHIGNDVDAAIHHKIVNIIHDNWDSSCERGVS